MWFDTLFFRVLKALGAELPDRRYLTFGAGLKATDNPADDSTDLEVDPSTIDASAAGAAVNLGDPDPITNLSKPFVFSAGSSGGFLTIQYAAVGPLGLAYVLGSTDALLLSCTKSGNDCNVSIADGVSLQVAGTTSYIKLTVDGNRLIEVNPDGLGFFGETPVARPVLSGSCGGNAGAYSVGQALLLLGLAETDGTFVLT